MMRNKVAPSASSMKLLWGVAPVMIMNFLEEGLVDSKFNSALAKAAVAAFDEYTSSAGATNKNEGSGQGSGSGSRRRKGHRSSSSTIGTVAPRLPPLRAQNNNTTNVKRATTEATPNDRFFEHQRMRAYRLATPSIASCVEAVRLQDELLTAAVSTYLKSIDAHPLLIDRLTTTGELGIDLWAAVQQGQGAHHKDHVHKGVLVSGVYYAAVPEGSAPLVLRCPETKTAADAFTMQQHPNEPEDVVLPAKEGQLVVFPPWLMHCVPPAGSETLATAKGVESPALCLDQNQHLPRVSFAFNLSGAYTWGDPWDVTRVT